MLQKLRERMGREEGFTLIELLVVMLILGILAAIAIPSFINQREKAQDADAKAAARTAQTAMETYATDNNGSYVGATTTNLTTIEPALADYTWSIVGTPTSTDYTVRGTNTDANPDRNFDVVRTGGTFNFTCAPNGGGCDGNWEN
jgi:type IV pilus assembly protein PilA